MHGTPIDKDIDTVDIACFLATEKHDNFSDFGWVSPTAYRNGVARSFFTVCAEPELLFDNSWGQQPRHRKMDCDIRGVLTAPGKTELTRIPSLPYAIASQRERPITPAFVATY